MKEEEEGRRKPSGKRARKWKGEGEGGGGRQETQPALRKCIHADFCTVQKERWLTGDTHTHIHPKVMV